MSADSPAELALLRMAFELHIVDLIVEADEHVSSAEEAWVARHYPRERLTELGLVDQSGERTDRFHDLAMEALDTLPKVLSEADKFTLLEHFFAVTVADGDFAYREGNVLLIAARLLGIPNDKVLNFLSQHPDVGELELSDIDLDD